jgi:hypothetical protein
MERIQVSEILWGNLKKKNRKEKLLPGSFGTPSLSQNSSQK